jgi:DNA adenine methylase
VYQLQLFEQPNRVVNVASVPQRSPFRYAGGKTWLVPRVRRWIAQHMQRRSGLQPVTIPEFIEPFAGGGIISLTVAAERLAEHVTMVELDEDVGAVWQTILDLDSSEWLAQRILTFDLNYHNVQNLLNAFPTSMQERAFVTIVKNRTLHGGILAPGAGLIKRGENDKGITSRWYPETLARRIRDIAKMRDRISFIQGDGFAILEANANHNDAVFFIDPPYTVKGKGKRAGKRLYRYNEVDHDRLFALAETLRGDCLLTYDVADEVRDLAIRHHLNYQPVAMKNTHHATMDEYLIGPNLSWLEW